MCVARHGQITQSNKFAIYLQYLEKKVSNEVDSLRADKHESLLQIDTMTQFSLRRMQSHARAQEYTQVSLHVQFIACAKS